MAAPVVSRGTKGGYLIVRTDKSGFIAANTTQIVGANTSGEVVTGMTLSSIYFGATGANVALMGWTIARGANTILQVSGTGFQKFQEDAIVLESTADAAANVVFTKVGAGPASLVLKFHKSGYKIAGGSSY